MEIDGKIAGFSASDARDGSIWGLFVDPVYEGQGLGTRLLRSVCADLKSEGCRMARLSTDAGTNTAALYPKLGGKDAGTAQNGEVRFEVMLDL